MIQLRRRQTADEIAEATRAEVERRRLLAQFERDQVEADRAERRRTEKRRRKERARARARRRAVLRRYAETARTVGPLLLVNAAAVGGQLAYAYDQTPTTWAAPVRAAVAIGVAAAAESVALYVGWHAHDALLAGAHTTATRLRRASYAIALVMALVNYSHFADGLTKPTALAVILGVLSSLSPWLWGLHTRRAQHVQLLRRDLVDEAGATFSAARRRAFPVRSWLARRWSIDHGVVHPGEAWDGYRAHRAAQRAAAPTGRVRAAWSALLGRTAAPAPAEPTSEPEPVRLDDPDIRRCAELRQQMATARDRLTVGAARVALLDRDPGRWADLSGGLWDMVAATDEPAHVRRPAPLVPAHQRVIAEPVTVSRSEPVKAEPVSPATTAAADRVRAAHDREPHATHERIAELAGCSLATVKRHRPKRLKVSGSRAAEMPGQMVAV